MPRFFLEVAYKGTRFSGFQVQENAVTVQSEVEHAFALVQRTKVTLTGSSRTDAGVHALQNFFHFDLEVPLHPQLLYKMNAILPHDLVVKRIYAMGPEAHSRFEATSREYEYHLYRQKDPFLKEVAYHFPYALDKDKLNEVADFVLHQTNFWAFCKTNTQVKNFNCTLYKSEWIERDGMLIYNVSGNRFLRGMVRLLTATQLKVARGKYGVGEFKALFAGTVKCGFSIPAHGLFLKQVVYPEKYFSEPVQTI